MARDLIPHADVPNLDDLTLTEARFEVELADAPVVPAGPPRVIIVVDATSSMDEALPVRKITVAKAQIIVRPLFEIDGTQVQVISFRGAGECKASPWFSDPEKAARTIANIKHKPGWTQHHRAFQRVLDEARKQPVHAVLVITDAIEPRGPRNEEGDDWEDLCKDMLKLRRGGTMVHFVYKGSAPGGCPFNRAHPNVEEQLRKLRDDSDGTVLLYAPGDPKFTEQLHQIAADIAVRAQGSPGDALLLADMRQVPFSLDAVGEEVVVARCRSAGGDDDRAG